MLTLYYSKNSSALAAHILLEEVGATYALVDVPMSEGAQKRDDYLAINPKARIPSLGTPEGVITENPAILTFIAATHPDAGMLPATPFERAQADSLNAYLCSTMHVAYAHKFRGARWSDDPATFPAMEAKVAENLRESATLIEKHFLHGPWVMGDTFTLCDAYLALVPRWLAATGVDLAAFPKLEAHWAALHARPAAGRILAFHGV